MTCRLCAHPLDEMVVSLGVSPLANSFLTKDQLSDDEPKYPLDVYVCAQCFLVQLPQHESPEHIFSDYAYFSSFSNLYLAHAKAFAESITQRLGLNAHSSVIEIGSNDGYLLQYFLDQGIPSLGIEPAANIAKVAKDKGIPTENIFFSSAAALALKANGKGADLLVGNNVLAHVPDLNDFIKGLKIILNPQGVLTMEFPHLKKLLDEVQFDTIYHEHFSYFSLISAQAAFAKHGLRVFDVEECPTHGGSLRVYACHQDDQSHPQQPRVAALLRVEEQAGYRDIALYRGFDLKVKRVKEQICAFFARVRREGKRVAGYGAAAKGNTLFNYCGITQNDIAFVVDRNPYKQGRFLPGSHIPVVGENHFKENHPEYVFIIPWNLKDEIMAQLNYIRQWHGKFVVPIPQVEVL